MMTQTPFVTAEHSISPRAGVWVMIETWSIMIDGAPTPHKFVVRTSTGYRAVLPACWRDECLRAEPITRCVKKDCPESSRVHCHATHIEHAEAFAKKVSASYGSANRAETTRATLRRHDCRVSSVSIKAWADNPYARALEGR